MAKFGATMQKQKDMYINGYNSLFPKPLQYNYTPLIKDSAEDSNLLIVPYPYLMH